MRWLLLVLRCGAGVARADELNPPGLCIDASACRRTLHKTNPAGPSPQFQLHDATPDDIGKPVWEDTAAIPAWQPNRLALMAENLDTVPTPLAKAQLADMYRPAIFARQAANHIKVLAAE